jgi:predicted nucleic acid-binding protein
VPGGVVILVDTSVWIEAFAKPPRVDLTRLADVDEIVICLPIYQEVLQGFRDEFAFRRARNAMSAMPMVEAPLQAEVFDEAVALYRSARRVGLTVRSTIDCLIAACALRHQLEILHLDRDFDLLARISSLRVRSAR